MGVVGGECAVKGTGVKSHPCHCCGSTRISTAVGPSVVIQVHKHRRSSRKSQSNLNNNNINHHQELVFVQEPEVLPPNSPTTTSTDNILAPLKSKMKVLKKLKRKMGLGRVNDIDRFLSLSHSLLPSSSFVLLSSYPATSPVVSSGVSSSTSPIFISTAPVFPDVKNFPEDIPVV
ncbi:hypothetical protein KQX54_014686 [Cotesia glomerata]|uniref:Uncharacterized protein n=1 Tax=Cotesia glomerata TaxID=32391 RepID=A0AAV7IPA4_COTGL|nr:hypothetical protein KQX54_014686 [Cotesia glomerata]